MLLIQGQILLITNLQRGKHRPFWHFFFLIVYPQYTDGRGGIQPTEQKSAAYLGVERTMLKGLSQKEVPGLVIIHPRKLS